MKLQGSCYTKKQSRTKISYSANDIDIVWRLIFMASLINAIFQILYTYFSLTWDIGRIVYDKTTPHLFGKMWGYMFIYSDIYAFANVAMIIQLLAMPLMYGKHNYI